MCIFIFISRKRERKRGKREGERERKKMIKKRGGGKKIAGSFFVLYVWIYIYCIYILYIIVQRERRWMVREPAGALSRFLSSIFFSLDACVW